MLTGAARVRRGLLNRRFQYLTADQRRQAVNRFARSLNLSVCCADLVVGLFEPLTDSLEPVTHGVEPLTDRVELFAHLCETSSHLRDHHDLHVGGELRLPFKQELDGLLNDRTI